MSLNETHETEIAKYLNYFHKKRGELEYELETIADEFIENNLNEDLFTKADVRSDSGGGRVTEEDQRAEQAARGQRPEQPDQAVWRLPQVLPLCGSRQRRGSMHQHEPHRRRVVSAENRKAKDSIASLESKDLKKGLTAAGKLPSVAIGMEMQEHIRDIEKQMAKLKEKNQMLEQELLASKKSQSAHLMREDLEGNESIASLKEENLNLTVGSIYPRQRCSC